MIKTYNTPFAKETNFSDQQINAIKIKLDEDGLSWSSKWVDLVELFAKLSAPRFCEKVAISIRIVLMYTETIMIPDGYNGDADPIAQDKNAYKLRINGSYMTMWISKELYKICAK